MENSAKLTDNSLFKVIYSTKRKIETTREDWVHDIPFILIPSELIAGFRDQRFTLKSTA